MGDIGDPVSEHFTVAEIVRVTIIFSLLEYHHMVELCFHCARRTENSALLYGILISVIHMSLFLSTAFLGDCPRLTKCILLFY